MYLHAGVYALHQMHFYFRVVCTCWRTWAFIMLTYVSYTRWAFSEVYEAK